MHGTKNITQGMTLLSNLRVASTSQPLKAVVWTLALMQCNPVTSPGVSAALGRCWHFTSNANSVCVCWLDMFSPVMMRLSWRPAGHITCTRRCSPHLPAMPCKFVLACVHVCLCVHAFMHANSSYCHAAIKGCHTCARTRRLVSTVILLQPPCRAAHLCIAVE